MDTPSLTETLPTPDASQPAPELSPPTVDQTQPTVDQTASAPSIGVLGTVDVLTDVEDAEYQACQAVIALGWQNFVDVGLAFARIRDLRLYRLEFPTFEAYCRDRWQYGRRYVNRVISAAQVFTHLVTGTFPPIQL